MCKTSGLKVSERNLNVYLYESKLSGILDYICTICLNNGEKKKVLVVHHCGFLDSSNVLLNCSPCFFVLSCHVAGILVLQI